MIASPTVGRWAGIKRLFLPLPPPPSLSPKRCFWILSELISLCQARTLFFTLWGKRETVVWRFSRRFLLGCFEPASFLLFFGCRLYRIFTVWCFRIAIRLRLRFYWVGFASVNFCLLHYFSILNEWSIVKLFPIFSLKKIVNKKKEKKCQKFERILIDSPEVTFIIWILKFWDFHI